MFKLIAFLYGCLLKYNKVIFEVKGYEKYPLAVLLNQESYKIVSFPRFH